MNPPFELKTARLRLRELTPKDAGFIMELLNEPSFIRNIADRKVRDLEGARNYIAQGPGASYAKHGFGLWCVEREDGLAIGLCGLLQRDSLLHPDLGYALLERHWGKGYAREAAAAARDYGHALLGMQRIHAIVTPGNEPSVKLLHKLGFRDEGRRRLAGIEEEVLMLTWGQ